MTENSTSPHSATASGRHLIWLDDGRMGHQRQCWALIRGLQQKTGQKKAGLTVHRYRIPAYVAWRYQCGGRWLVHHELAGLLANQPATAILLSAGRRAAAVSLACRVIDNKYFRIQILDPRRRREDFDVLIVPEHDQLQAPNVLTMHGSLHDMRPPMLIAWRRASSNLLSMRSPRHGVLLAGNAQQNETLFKTAANALLAGGSLLICTSSRSGDCTDLLQKYALNRHPDVRLFGPGGTVHAASEQATSLQMVLAWSDVFMAAADSINQLNELLAIRDGRPIWIADDNISRRHQLFLQPLLGSRKVQRIAEFADGPHQDTSAVMADTPALVDQILQRLA